jgi:cytochrome c7-like protein/class III cytochrome C family protein
MRRSRNRALVVAVMWFAAILFLSGGLTAQKTLPSQTTKKLVPDNPSEHTPPVQPLPYSHKKHLSFGLECKNCHTNPEPGKLMTFPATGKCMECHITIAKEKPSILKLAEYSKSKQPIPWVRVYTVLPGVAWNHRAHLGAGVNCETCHGQVAQMDAMSEVTSVTTMYSCLSCHEMSHAKTACDTCHKH